MNTTKTPKLLNYFCFMCTSLAWLSCGQGKQTPSQASIKIVKIEQIKGNCDQAYSACFTAIIHMPQYEGELNEFQRSFNQIIQDEVNQYLAEFLDPDFKSTSIEATLDALYADFLQYAEEMEALQIPVPKSWSFEINGSSYYNHDHLLTVQFNVYSYTGGAHPNGFTTFVNIGEDGTSPSITEFVTDTIAVKSILLDLMKSKYSILNDTDISENGFWVTDSTFYLPQQFGLNDKGLIFVFNPYEISPYVMGSHEILIPYEALKPYWGFK
jgi:hypothetical protein